MLCKQLIPVRLWGGACLFKSRSIYSSMDRVSGFDPENVSSNLTKCLFKIEALEIFSGRPKLWLVNSFNFIKGGCLG